MSELNLIRQLGDRLGRPLEEVSAERFEQHVLAKYVWDGANQARISRDSYAVADDGTISGLFLETVTSHILLDFPFDHFRHLRHLHLAQVNLSSFEFLQEFKGLTTLDLSSNQISDCSFLSDLKGLNTLDLSDNQISDCSFLSDLKGLNTLDLSSNQISDCSFLSDLKGLNTLDLSDNQISDFSFLSDLKGLNTFYLSSNQISDCSFLSDLKGLNTLYLRFNQISDCSFLSDLKGLNTLDLSSNQISDFSFLSDLKGLNTLDLSDNQISDCSFLSDLRGLTTLDLRFNQISDFSFLSDLKGLNTLDLRSNQISDCSFLSDLKGLNTLDLRFNQISDCSFLSDLKGLNTLDLSSNQISDFSFLSDLKGLNTLDLSSNQISDCSFLSDLKGLNTLDLSDNQISDCSFLSDLKGLNTLDLSSNQISDCSFLSDLKGLNTLDLSDNQISDCSFLSDLKGLNTLDLSDNQIQEISKQLAEGRLAIVTDGYSSSGYINLRRNPIEQPPLEIASRGNEAILNYYDQSDTQGQVSLYEAKMLIVGEGESGKTTLAHKIHEPNCPLPHVDDRTRGISIQTHHFSCRKKDPSDGSNSCNFHLNVWDFGGQEIYHATHRFFLSKRSLYVLVADNRKDDTDFNYWLNIIEHFAGNSPLIIVLNEKGDIQRNLNQADLLSRYPESIKEIVSVNFKTKEESDQTKAQQRLKGIHTLIGHIEHCAQNLPHIGEPVPARWVDVRQAIETDSRNHIYREQFDKLCQSQNIIAAEDIDTLLSYFHDLGILLHFADNPLLRDRVILKPAWATNAVYRIFDDERIKDKVGRFSRQNCAEIWCDSQYRHMHDVLIELMKNFRLVYEIGTTGELVAPQLLPPNTPIYSWDKTQNSHMQLRYDAFMPKGIFWQFAVTMYRYIDNHAWVWRNGMVIRRGNTWAEVIEDLNLRRIDLRFSGPSIPEFRAVIVDELDKISQLYHRLDYDKMIPCQCSECTSSNQPHFFNYAVLKRRKESGKKSTIECQRSEEDISLSLLLEGFEVQTIVQHLPDKTGDEPTPPEFPQADPPTSAISSTRPSPKNIKIFLASSSELEDDRKEFEIFINRKNKEYIKGGTFLELVIWEDFLDAMSQTRLQDEYNKAITDCDIFVSLFYSKVGKYTKEEFLKALITFKANGKPLIYTYFKKLVTEVTRSNRKYFESLWDFQDELSNQGHFYTEYANIEDLKYKFGEQLVKFLPKSTGTDLKSA